ncbi:hypothetical protein GB928_025530 [Shinella curvata]|uniref:Uncharacterized protein n=1 Tax=Shinella curvata TaxID=1817964 RepID=A0ABT8XLF4_9HYPH|nr:hypothetical protein [Shinella curvata]MCJ8056603.1 hypothetical protein [Shinella curvata]MDO6124557.1 hypothetical protein [Shinella curvata]
MPSRFVRPLCLFRALAAASAMIAFTIPTVQAAGSECSTRGADIIRQAYPDAQPVSKRKFRIGDETILLPTDVGNHPHELICKRWPARPELMLVAAPLMTSQSDDGNTGDVELLVLESDSLKLKQRLRLPGLLTDDAFFVSRVALDTAYYRLSVSDLAFGLRIERRGSSGPNPFGETTLWLFVINDGALRPVLDNIVVAGHQGEWDTNCTGQFQSIERTLAMGYSSPNSYSDIMITETKTNTISTVGRDGGCLNKETKAQTVRHLSSRGFVYQVPADLKRIE